MNVKKKNLGSLLPVFGSFYAIRLPTGLSLIVRDLLWIKGNLSLKKYFTLKLSIES